MNDKWNGVDLPPVGAECEIKHDMLGWVRCEIVAHKYMDDNGKAHAIAWIDGNTLDQSQGIRFRPIRTPEQIALDERDKASVELAGILAGHDQHIAVRDIEMAKYLYDIGYRKQVKP